MNANTSRKTIHFSDNMKAKDENALSSRLRALIRKKRNENVSTFSAKKDQRKNIGCLRKNCLKTFLNSYQLKQHIQTHSKDGSYKCEKCGNFFTDPISLRSHKNHSTLCEESDISLKLNNSLDQNPPWRSQSEKESGGRYLSTSDILAELIIFSPDSSPPAVDEHDKNSPPHPISSNSNSSDILDALVNFTPIDFQESKEIGAKETLEQTPKDHWFKMSASPHENRIDTDVVEVKTAVEKIAVGSFTKKHFPPNSKIKFQCQVCRLDFDRKATLKEHLLVHSKWEDRKSWGCHICKLCFTTRGQLRIHTKSIHTVTIGRPGANLPVVGKLRQFRKHNQPEVVWLE